MKLYNTFVISVVDRFNGVIQQSNFNCIQDNILLHKGDVTPCANSTGKSKKLGSSPLCNEPILLITTKQPVSLDSLSWLAATTNCHEIIITSTNQ